MAPTLLGTAEEPSYVDLEMSPRWSRLTIPAAMSTAVQKPPLMLLGNQGVGPQALESSMDPMDPEKFLPVAEQPLQAVGSVGPAVA